MAQWLDFWRQVWLDLMQLSLFWLNMEWYENIEGPVLTLSKLSKRAVYR